MEVAAGQTVGLADHISLPAFCGGDDDDKDLRANGFCFVGEKAEDSSESSSSSSIGAPSDSDDEVQSQLKNNNPLGSLDSLQDTLPIKRGLSNFFTGKSKSFASLSEAASSADLAKPENPFNKRQRILMACKSSRSRRASYSTLLPTLADGDEEDDDQVSDQPALPLHSLLRRRRDENKFRSPRSFSLSDLQRV